MFRGKNIPFSHNFVMVFCHITLSSLNILQDLANNIQALDSQSMGCLVPLYDTQCLGSKHASSVKANNYFGSNNLPYFHDDKHLDLRQ